MARRQRSEAKFTGGGRIAQAATDNLLGGKRPLGPIGKVVKSGFKVSKVPKTSAK